MTMAEIEAALASMVQLSNGTWLTTPPGPRWRLYSGLTPSQASDLYNWGFR